MTLDLCACLIVLMFEAFYKEYFCQLKVLKWLYAINSHVTWENVSKVIVVVNIRKVNGFFFFGGFREVSGDITKFFSTSWDKYHLLKFSYCWWFWLGNSICKMGVTVYGKWSDFVDLFRDR